MAVFYSMFSIEKEKRHDVHRIMLLMCCVRMCLALRAYNMVYCYRIRLTHIPIVLIGSIYVSAPLLRSFSVSLFQPSPPPPSLSPLTYTLTQFIVPQDKK